MIKSASELLEKFIKEESRREEEFNKQPGNKMEHMPTLGDAYEEITKQGIDKEYILPKGLNLRVVSGFIRVDGVMCEKHIDCMLVYGDGEKYLLTKNFIYDLESVLCVFEVKKTLSKKYLRDAMEHQDVLKKEIGKYLDKKITTEGGEINANISIAGNIYSYITGKKYPLNNSDISNMSEADKSIYFTVLKEQMSPVFIIHGYRGIKTESGLRNAFCDLIEEFLKKSQDKVKINSLPNLITSNEFSLIKTNGMPFLASNNNGWFIYGSARHNVARLILEMIWSKISTRFNVRMPFDDELYQENIAALLGVDVSEEEGRLQWAYKTIEEKEINLKRDDDCHWEPYKISEAAIHVVSVMGLRGGYLKDDDYSDGFLFDKYGVTFTSILSELLGSKFFMRDGDYIRSISESIHIADVDEKGGYLSTDMHKLRLWCEKEKLRPFFMTNQFL